jgi:hypothetical protein
MTAMMARANVKWTTRFTVSNSQEFTRINPSQAYSPAAIAAPEYHSYLHKNDPASSLLATCRYEITDKIPYDPYLSSLQILLLGLDFEMT